jgi:hypothetical protein
MLQPMLLSGLGLSFPPHIIDHACLEVVAISSMTMALSLFSDVPSLRRAEGGASDAEKRLKNRGGGGLCCMIRIHGNAEIHW